MSPSTALPRPDQIAELTRGLDLPLAPIDDMFLQLIAERVAQAFDDIRASAPLTVSSGEEAEVTALLEARLNAMIEEDMVWRQLVASVVRGKESCSFDGAHLEKRPDLSIHLSARAIRFPLVAEAKIINATKGEALYCTQGLGRFLDGDYGWGSSEALMIAYVRDGTILASRLTPYLALPAHSATYAVQESPAELAIGHYDAARSKHGRSFLYTHTMPPANDPGPIAIWHLWLNALALP